MAEDGKDVLVVRRTQVVCIGDDSIHRRTKAPAYLSVGEYRPGGRQRCIGKLLAPQRPKPSMIAAQEQCGMGEEAIGNWRKSWARKVGKNIQADMDGRLLPE